LRSPARANFVGKGVRAERPEAQRESVRNTEKERNGANLNSGCGLGGTSSFGKILSTIKVARPQREKESCRERRRVSSGQGEEGNMQDAVRVIVQ